MQNNILQSSLNALMITYKLKHIKATLFFSQQHNFKQMSTK